MALPALAWIILGGTAVAVAAGSSKSGKGSVATIKLPGPAFEKFADGWYYCYGSPYRQEPDRPKGVPTILGYEYLASVPANANARVAAMRAKINAGPSSTDGTKPIEESSLQAMRRIATDIARANKDPNARRALAARVGIPVAQIESAIGNFGKLAESYVPGSASFVNSLTQYGTEYTLRLVRELAQKLVAEMVGNSTATAAAESIPIIGQIIQAYTKLASALYEVKQEEFKLNCEQWVDGLTKKMSMLTGYGYPIPWHVFDRFSAACREPAGSSLTPAAEKWTETQDQENIMRVMTAAFDHFNKLTVKDTLAITDWWALSTTFMSDSRITRVFATMCNDSWGGIVGSDEQVMVVSAPIALSRGLDIDALARRLWAESGGWRSRVDLVRRTTLSVPVYSDTSGIGAHAEDIDHWDTLCKNVPINAWALNFVALCKDAFRIADDMKKKGEGKPVKSFVHLAPIAPL